ncbi:MAG TPA: hypothetical protein VEO01_15940 [Pseudonocardiaceae bacterium]|nr:hypothetical protein [Pseudonocardiaceae bacterium]
MSRRWLVYLPLALTLAGTVALPTAAFAAGHDNPPAPACTKDTQQVKDLTTAVTNLGTAVSATTPDPTAVSQAAGDIFNAITAAQGAGCLPALPTSPPAATPPPPAAAPMASHDAAKCATDTVQALTATLAQISAGTAAKPDPAAVLKAANDLATAITAINTDTCLPVSLPVPTVPAPPAPPTPPAT